MNLTGQPIHQKGQKPAKVPVMRNASRGKECSLSLPGVCRHLPEYVVGAHLRLPWLCGGGQKPDDLFLMDACDRCHEVQEAFFGDPDAPMGWDDVVRGLTKSQMHRRASGLILLKGET